VNCRISLRAGLAEEFAYCAKLYFADRKNSIDECDPDVADLRKRWRVEEVRIIERDGDGVGWIQTRFESDTIFIVQFFIDIRHQRKGIGSDVLRQIIDEGHRVSRGVTLGVVKTNPALELYRKFGFQVTHEDERKFYMKRNLVDHETGNRT